MVGLLRCVSSLSPVCQRSWLTVMVASCARIAGHGSRGPIGVLQDVAVGSLVLGATWYRSCRVLATRLVIEQRGENPVVAFGAVGVIGKGEGCLYALTRSARRRP